MKTQNWIQKTIGVSLSTLMTAQAFASSLDISVPRGESTVQHKSPSGLIELCTIPQRLSQEAFSEKDRKNEAEICATSFYGENPVCPKQNSTNPGLLIGEPVQGMSAGQVQARYCEGPNKKVFRTEYKYKQGISCSYTPSILAYYQFGRLLDAGRVPIAVLRTMDRREHLKQVEMALTFNMAPPMPSQWGHFRDNHSQGTNTNIFDSSRKFVYGSLVKNVKKESRYREVSGIGSYETRYERFIEQPPFQRVASDRSIEDMAREVQGANEKATGVNRSQRLIQTVVQLKDVSDMVLLDTLLSQDDRIGNIHSKFAWYWVDANGKLQTMKSEAEEPKSNVYEVPAKEMAEFGKKAVLIREMILKDNDCGVDINKRSNMMRKMSALEQVRHMSAHTYARFMSLAKIANTPAFESWMQREMLYTTADFKGSGRSFQKNFEKAYQILTENCRSGFLKLDANIQDFLPGAQKIRMGCDGQEIR